MLLSKKKSFFQFSCTVLKILAIFVSYKTIKQRVMNTYIENIIKTGLANGATLEEMMANPEAAHKAYLEAQLKAIDKAGEKLKKEYESA